MLREEVCLTLRRTNPTASFCVVVFEIYLLENSFLYFSFDRKFTVFPLFVLRFLCHNFRNMQFFTYVSNLVHKEQGCFSRLLILFSSLANQFSLGVDKQCWCFFWMNFLSVSRSRRLISFPNFGKVDQPYNRRVMGHKFKNVNIEFFRQGMRLIVGNLFSFKLFMPLSIS